MRILLDECIDRRLAKEFAGYEVLTVPQMEWAGIKNGQLLALAAVEFDVFITVDRNLPLQQKLSQFDVAVVVLQAVSNRVVDLKPLIPEVVAILGTAPKGQATTLGESQKE